VNTIEGTAGSLSQPEVRTMRKEPERLTELLGQVFPKKDPIELERIIETVEKWLEQKRKEHEKTVRLLTNRYGENAEPTRISKSYVHCIDDLLNGIDPRKYPIHT